MDPIALIVVSVVVLIIVASIPKWIKGMRREITVYDYERGLLYTEGRFQRVLEGGRHVFWDNKSEIFRIDMRETVDTLSGQELLCSDGVTVRIGASIIYKVSDPMLAWNAAENYRVAAYTAIHAALRDVVTAKTSEELLSQRHEIGNEVKALVTTRFVEIGMSLSQVSVRDITFPGEFKKVMAQLAQARKEGEAALERARGESAALRSLANAAKMLDSNPALYQLRVLHALERSPGSTIVIGEAPMLSGSKDVATPPKKPSQQVLDI